MKCIQNEQENYPAIELLTTYRHGVFLTNRHWFVLRGQKQKRLGTTAPKKSMILLTYTNTCGSQTLCKIGHMEIKASISLHKKNTLKVRLLLRSYSRVLEYKFYNMILVPSATSVSILIKSRVSCTWLPHRFPISFKRITVLSVQLCPASVCFTLCLHVHTLMPVLCLFPVEKQVCSFEDAF